MKPAIEIRNLGKQYKLSTAQPYIALRDVITDATRNLFRPQKKITDKFWALKDINLDILPGERVGIIGRNGAGKSTLLKIISRITPPTSGYATIRGRVGSLLEVGTGFHNELTGRENIYLNGSILGLKKAEINKQLDAIINFSGIEKFIDTQLKHYSSGMQLRLAFSVAAHLEPEILLIDEVLAVGDAEFQKKCLGKMEEVSKEHGRTILFVSHQMDPISTITNKCLVLDKGNAVFWGTSNEAIRFYRQLTKTDELIYEGKEQTEKPSVTKIRIVSSELNNMHIHGQPLSIIFEINNPTKRDSLALSFQIVDENSRPVLYAWCLDNNIVSLRSPGKHVIKCTFPRFHLYKGSYSVSTYLGDEKGMESLHKLKEAVSFEVTMYGLDSGRAYGWQDNVCVYREEHHWELINNF
jgi:lipopolysaccharide transport system ATP-binding protein